MFKTPKSKWLALGTIVLLALNLAAVYILNQSIDKRKLLVHANPDLKITIQQQVAFGNVFSAAVFTLDIIVILILLYLFLKMLIRILKSPTPKS